MEIIYARKMGFCHGVRKAFEGAMRLAESLCYNAHSPNILNTSTSDPHCASASIRLKKGESADSVPIYIMGELVHNRAVVSRIEKWGIKHVHTVEEIKEANARVIIRAHGDTKQTFEKLKERGFEVIDLTCPVVKKVRERALELEKSHPAVVVFGKKNHPEVVGLVSWLKHPFIVAEPEDIENVPNYSSVGAIAQTTFSRHKVYKLLSILRKKVGSVEFLDTICPYTDRNQQASEEVAAMCDIMLVVGDWHSSNSKQLFDVVRKVNPNTYFICVPNDIDPSWFPPKESARAKRFKVGITAGASTPDWIIEEITRNIRSLE